MCNIKKELETLYMAKKHYALLISNNNNDNGVNNMMRIINNRIEELENDSKKEMRETRWGDMETVRIIEAAKRLGITNITRTWSTKHNRARIATTIENYDLLSTDAKMQHKRYSEFLATSKNVEIWQQREQKEQQERAARKARIAARKAARKAN